MAKVEWAELSDAALVKRIQTGEREAFGVLYDRHYTKVFRHVHLKVGGREDAEDLTQEVFYRALKNIHRLHVPPEGSAYPWLHRITANLIVDFYRAHPMPEENEAWSGLDVAAYLDQMPNGGPSPYEIVERKELYGLVRRAIADLPPDQARVIDYRFVGELSLKEIAAEMERTEGAIKSLLHRAIHNVRAWLEQAGETPTVARVALAEGEVQHHERRGVVRLRR
jgi:RNA polymerase sigma-70 factor (ECF subfamily)